MEVHGLAFIGEDIGAIGAVVLQHKPVMGAFDAGMISRGQIVRYDQFVARITSHRDGTTYLMEPDLLFPMAKEEVKRGQVVS